MSSSTTVHSLPVRQAGGIQRHALPLGAYPDGSPLLAPMLVVDGAREGPTLWVQACVHGPEVGGVLGIHDFLRGLDRTALSGRIVFLLLANPLGFRGNQRLTPQDGVNMNRAFPGSEDGGPTAQMAARIMALAAEVAPKAVLDLHSGGDHAISAHYSIFSDIGNDAGNRSRRLAQALGADFLWNAPVAALDGAAYLAFIRNGIPSVLFETGGGARVGDDDIGNYSRAILRATQFLGMLPGEAAPQAAIEGSEVINVRARHGGIFLPATTVGSRMGSGAAIGTIVDIFGTVVEALASPFPDGLVTALRRPRMPVYAGDDVFSVMKI